MTAQVETRRFEAEVQELLGLMIHSLYTEKEIFLRELISNASDALDKLRIEALTNEGLVSADDVLEIRIEADAAERTVSVVDGGIGMSREELAENLGTIARSGTRAFLEQLEAAKQGGDAASMIGQFGVGFYASFMVADEVVVESRKAGTEHGARWRSKADGEFTLEDAEGLPRGTRVTLHLKPVEPDAEDKQDFADPHALAAIVKRHSDFVEHPIRMDMEEWEIERDEEGKPVEGGERKKTVVTKTLNSQKPLWARPRSEISDEDYKEFYKHVAHDWNDPLEHLHVVADVPVSYTAVLFVPSQRPLDMLRGPEGKSQISLYVRRVLIMRDCEDLLPVWLRFVRGVVESDDLPLNVSRQTLQANPLTRRIQKHLVSRLLKTLRTMLADDRERYQQFFDAFGSVLKEGIYYGDDDDHRVSSLCLWRGTTAETPMTLDEYVEQMPSDQEAIYFITGGDADTLAASPHLEAYRAKGTEVLLLSDPVDEWVLSRLDTYRDKPLKAVTHGEAPVEEEQERKAREEKQETHKDLLEALQTALDEHVSEVRFTSRLKDSPAVLVSQEGALSPSMERMLREIHGEAPATKRILELNPDHALMTRLQSRFASGAESEAFRSYAKLLFGQALLAEGSPLPDPAAFSRLVTNLMVGGGDAAAGDVSEA